MSDPIRDEVPQRMFGVQLPVAPLIRDLKIDVRGAGNVVSVAALLQVGDLSYPVSIEKRVDLPVESEGIVDFAYRPSLWLTLGREIDRRFALPSGSGDVVAELLKRIVAVSEVVVAKRGIFGAVETQEELRGILETYATEPA